MSRSYICWHCLHGTSQSAAALKLRHNIGRVYLSRNFSRSAHQNLSSTTQALEEHLPSESTEFREISDDVSLSGKTIKAQKRLDKRPSDFNTSPRNEYTKSIPPHGSIRKVKLGLGYRQSTQAKWLVPTVEAELKALIGKSKTPLEMWHRLMATEAFQSPSIPQSVEITLQRSPQLRKVFLIFIHESIYGSSSLFPPLDKVLGTFVHRGFFRYQMLWHVLEDTRPQLVNAVFGPLASPPQDGDRNEAVRLLTAIIETWRLALHRLSTPFTNPNSDGVLEWNGLPTPYELESALSKYSDYFERFTTIFPGRVDSRLEKVLASDSAWVYLSFEDLRRRDLIPEDLLQAWKPWTDLMERLVAPTRLANPGYLHRILNNTSRSFDRNFVSAVIQQDRLNLYKPQGSALENSLGPSSEQYVTIDGQKYLGAGSFRSRLTYASRKGHHGRAVDLWYEFTKSTTKSDSTKDYRSAVIAEFIWYFARCGQPDRALQAWQLLGKSSIHPLPAHWTGLVEAARAAGGVALLQEVWPIMSKIGHPPNQAWTAYIAALFKQRADGHALAAVSALDKQWENRPQPQGEDFAMYGPSIIPINAAVSGLLARDNLDPIDALLSLANKYELKPTTDTYNIFLRHAIKEQNSHRISQIFEEMKLGNCEPDVVTFTLVIDSLLRQPTSPLRSAGASEQEKAVEQLFTDLASVDLEPSAHTYTTLLKALLDEAEPQLSAVQAILQRMSRQGMSNNSYAYTALVGHYFSRKPPDIQAIERVMQAISDQRLRLDPEFYDRLTRGFAEAGQYEQMLAALRRLDLYGKPKLRTAIAVLTFLVEEGDLETARQLVLKIEREVLNPNLTLDKRDREDMRRWSRVVQELRTNGVVPAPRTATFRTVQLGGQDFSR